MDSGIAYEFVLANEVDRARGWEEVRRDVFDWENLHFPRRIVAGREVEDWSWLVLSIRSETSSM